MLIAKKCESFTGFDDENERSCFDEWRFEDWDWNDGVISFFRGVDAKGFIFLQVIIMGVSISARDKKNSNIMT